MKLRQLLKLTAKELKEKEFDKVIVTYIDKSKRIFSIDEFDIFKKGIIENLFNKNKCNIKFKKKTLLEKLIPKHNICSECKKNTLTVKMKEGVVGCRNCGNFQLDNQNINNYAGKLQS